VCRKVDYSERQEAAARETYDAPMESLLSRTRRAENEGTRTRPPRVLQPLDPPNIAFLLVNWVARVRPAGDF